MSAWTWLWRAVCVGGVAAGLCLPGPGRAEDKDKKGSANDDKRVIVIQLDAGKVPPELLKQLLELAKSTGKVGDKKPAPKKVVDKKPAFKKVVEKKPTPKKVVDKKPAFKKVGVKKPHIVQVDLNQLPPDLAKRLLVELAKNPVKEVKKDKPKKDIDAEKGGKGKVKKGDDEKGGKKEDD